MMGELSLEMRARKVERQRQKGPEEIVNLEGEKRKINGEADEELLMSRMKLGRSTGKGKRRCGRSIASVFRRGEIEARKLL
jgi:hypothetical protein